MKSVSTYMIKCDVNWHKMIEEDLTCLEKKRQNIEDITRLYEFRNGAQVSLSFYLHVFHYSITELILFSVI